MNPVKTFQLAYQFLHDVIVYGAFGFLEAIKGISVAVWQFARAFVHGAYAFFYSDLFQNHYRVIFILVFIANFFNMIIINEEILVLICFGLAVYFLYENLSDSVTESLNERSDGIRKELSSFLLIKQENLNELYKSEASLLNTSQNLLVLQNYCQEHFIELENNQQKALVGLVAQNFVQKLDALSTASAGLTPSVHKQISTSFRESILEKFNKKRRKKQRKSLKKALSLLQNLYN